MRSFDDGITLLEHFFARGPEMKFKRFIGLLLTAVLLCVPAFAHSGRTDANGGHYESATGEYHYHHGYPAHQHYDMDGDGIVDCPYEFDNQTGKNSGSSSSGEKRETNNAVFASENSEKNEGGSNWLTVMLSILVYPAGFFALCFLFSLPGIIRDRKKYKIEKELYTSQYAGKSMEQLVHIPPGSSIGTDGLPRSARAGGKWGSEYTFYVTKSGHAYHRKYGCSGARDPVNAYDLKRYIMRGRYKWFKPCGRCKPTFPNWGWVDQYKEIERIKKKYKI